MGNSNYVYGSFSRMSNFPLEDRYLFNTIDDLKKYITQKPTTAYNGQLVYVIDEDCLYLIKNVDECNIDPISVDERLNKVIEYLKESINKYKKAVSESGKYSSAFGVGTISSNDSEFSVGKYNKNDRTSVFTVGIGTDDANRKNGLCVYDDGRVSIGNNPIDENDIVTKQYLDNTISNIDIIDRNGIIQIIKEYNIENGTTDPNEINNSILEFNNILNSFNEDISKNNNSINSLEKYIDDTLVPSLENKIQSFLDLERVNPEDIDNIKTIIETKVDKSELDNILNNISENIKNNLDDSEIIKINSDIAELKSNKVDPSEIVNIKNKITELDSDIENIAKIVIEDYVSKKDLNTEIDNLIASAPGTLETLNKISQSLTNNTVIGSLSESLTTLSNNDKLLNDKLNATELEIENINSRLDNLEKKIDSVLLALTNKNNEV